MSMPSAPGILMSVTTRSTSSFSRISRPRAAEREDLTAYPSFLKPPVSRSRRLFSSSMIRIVSMVAALRSGRPAERQRDRDLGPLVELGADVDPPVVVVDDLADDGHPQAAAGLEARGEGLEEVLLVLVGQALPGVGEDDPGFFPLGAGEIEPQPPALRHGLDGVLDEVPEDLFELAGVAVKGDVRRPEVPRDLDLAVELSSPPEDLDRLVQDF